ncbi:hypothetical protein XENORESO_008261 [Xenotaenia resolanae]|uniref:Transposase n=1 Tax=Xenotaenia resolanae TaxID=208358 RepID=A0ABV0VSD9_9TELE
MSLARKETGTPMETHFADWFKESVHNPNRTTPIKVQNRNFLCFETALLTTAPYGQRPCHSWTNILKQKYQKSVFSLSIYEKQKVFSQSIQSVHHIMQKVICG